MQVGEVVALDIPARLFDLGPQIHGTGQGLIQQLNHVQADFQGYLDPYGMEDLVVVAMAHTFILTAFRVALPARAATSLWNVARSCPAPCETLFHAFTQDNYSGDGSRPLSQACETCWNLS